jgi:hypothetical protein
VFGALVLTRSNYSPGAIADPYEESPLVDYEDDGYPDENLAAEEEHSEERPPATPEHTGDRDNTRSPPRPQQEAPPTLADKRPVPNYLGDLGDLQAVVDATPGLPIYEVLDAILAHRHQQRHPARARPTADTPAPAAAAQAPAANRPAPATILAPAEDGRRGNRSADQPREERRRGRSRSRSRDGRRCRDRSDSRGASPRASRRSTPRAESRGRDRQASPAPQQLPVTSRLGDQPRRRGSNFANGLCRLQQAPPPAAAAATPCQPGQRPRRPASSDSGNPGAAGRNCTGNGSSPAGPCGTRKGPPVTPVPTQVT